MDRTEVADKIRKLLRLAQSDSVGEAAAAAGAAQALADKHALDLAELAIEDEELDLSDNEDDPLDMMERTQVWMVGLAVILAQHNGCEALTEPRETEEWQKRARAAKRQRKRRPPCPTAILICGPPPDVATVRYVYAYLRRVIDELAERDCVGRGRSYRRSYCMGAVNTIRRRLNEERQRVYEKARRAGLAFDQATTGPGTRRHAHALMRVDEAIARRNAQLDKVREWIEREMEVKHPKEGYYQPAADAGAYVAGGRAGRSVELGSDGPAIEQGGQRLPKGRTT